MADNDLEKNQTEHPTIIPPPGTWKPNVGGSSVGTITENSTEAEVIDVLKPFLPEKYREATTLYEIPEDVRNQAADSLQRAALDPSYGGWALDNNTQKRAMNIVWQAMGLGGYFNQMQTYMTSLDRYGSRTLLNPNQELVGYTFITRPRLCLQSSNLRNNRIMTALDTLNNSSMAFAIRCMLDSNFANANAGKDGKGRFLDYVAKCPLFDQENPFLVPLCNSLKSFTGSPDYNLETNTTDGGYFAEAQTYAVGADNFQRGTYDLTLEFTDVEYGPVFALIYYWLEYIRCVTRGIMLAYGDDIDAQRLNYTVSIYRFMTDPTRQYITKYSKYTGCFPKGLPIGNHFHFNEGDVVKPETARLSVPFVCNKVEYMDYAILMDFNALVRRYCPIINSATREKVVTKYEAIQKNAPVTRYFRDDYKGFQESPITQPILGYEAKQYVEQDDYQLEAVPDGSVTRGVARMKCPPLPPELLANYRALPYIVSDRHGFRLEWRKHSNMGDRGYTTTFGDQLLYLDFMNNIRGAHAKLDPITAMYYPEFYQTANEFKSVDLRGFIEKAFKDYATAESNHPI